jgi:hypothetical protein
MGERLEYYLAQFTLKLEFQSFRNKRAKSRTQNQTSVKSKSFTAVNATRYIVVIFDFYASKHKIEID